MSPAIPGSAARLAIFWSLAIALQWIHGAYRGDRAANVDESAHLVTGLMAREYLASGAARPPMEFARDYYLHYPKVALGHWPPVFYAEQAVWMLLFPASRGSVLVMLALQLAVLACLLWSSLRPRFGPVAAWCGAVVLETLPAVLAATVDVLAEVAVAVPILLAALAWRRFLERDNVRSAAVFGLWSAAAILTKATAIVLAPLPLLSVLLVGRTDLMRRARFWLPALIVAALCVPWHLLAPGALHDRVAHFGGAAMSSRRAALLWFGWTEPLGRPVAILAAVGVAVLLWRRVHGKRPDALLATAAAIAIAATLGRWSIKVWDARHVAETAPFFLILASSGAAWIVNLPLWRERALRAGGGLAVAAALLVAAGNLAHIRGREAFGYRRLAGAIVDGAAGSATTVLVAGDAAAEGSLIAELAQREPAPGRFAVRATKVFVDAAWMGKLKRARAGNCHEVYALLNSLPVDLVVIDSVHPAPYDYQSQLEQALAEHSDTWEALDLPGIAPGLKVLRRLDSSPLADAERAATLRAALPDPVP